MAKASTPKDEPGKELKFIFLPLNSNYYEPGHVLLVSKHIWKPTFISPGIRLSDLEFKTAYTQYRHM